MSSRILYWALAMSMATAAPAVAQQTAAPSTEEAAAIGRDAYVYGYPLVTMEITRRVMTNAAEPKDNHAPMGQFHHARTYPNASFRDVTAPNADTLYSTAWLDVSKEPYVLSIPDEDGRYFLMPMLDGWTTVFQVPGKRTTGTKAQSYAITGPNWKGDLPAGVVEYKSPTSIVWILGRTYCTGTPEELDHDLPSHLRDFVAGHVALSNNLVQIQRERDEAEKAAREELKKKQKSGTAAKTKVADVTTREEQKPAASPTSLGTMSLFDAPTEAPPQAAPNPVAAQRNDGAPTTTDNNSNNNNGGEQ